MAKVLDWEIRESEFELQLRYYVHFFTNSFGKDMNPIIPSYESNSTTTFLLQGCLWH